MLSIIRHDSIRKVQLDLPDSIRHKMAHPKHPDAVYDFYGNTERELTGRAIAEIDYTDGIVAQGMNPDGNWIEFTQWTGLNDDDMDVIRQLMVKHGWKLGNEEF